ncbi:MAG: phosphate acetyltransferase [Defluviitaleaceae bacterium]|nr:phosphate acetyltransferase [Defluviitaleaceae bacterium]MCL2262582.1 phosphate acetyltransferase [Defluviitaleaceae bacterium]
MDFLEAVKQRAKSQLKTIVLPESMEPRMLKATHQILAEGLAKIILIGNKAELEKAAAAENATISGATIIDPADYAEMDSLAEKLYELRKAKGLTLEEAKKTLAENAITLSNMLVKEGIADGMVAGAITSTADVLRPSLQILKTAPGVSIVSSFFVMVVPDCEYGNNGVFIFSDCGLIQNPNSEELAAIAISSATSYRALLGEEPIVALLSHSTMGSAKHPDVTKVQEAAKILKEKAPTLKADGEFQLDAAIVPSIGASKAPGNPVAGNANVLIFPDLDSGNIAYKLVERLAKAKAYGPVTQGISKPVNDLSRGCSAEDIVGVTAITAVQAQG